MLAYADEVQGFTLWELNFCDSLHTQMYRLDRDPTWRQMTVLDNGILKRLWMDDPSLWDEELHVQPLAHIVPTPSLRARWKTQRSMIARAQFLCDAELEAMLRAGLEDIEYLMERGMHIPPW